MRGRLEKMLADLRQEMVECNAAKGLTMGEILEVDKKLHGTAEGRTYEDFTAFMNDADQQAPFRAAVPASDRKSSTASGHENAERVTGRIGVHVRRLVRIVRPVKEQFCPQGQCPGMLTCKGLPVRNGKIQMQLHRHLGRRPSGPLQAVHQLESQPGATVGIGEDQPVDVVRLRLGRRLVIRPVPEPE
jgi:hypothetical protein